MLQQIHAKCNARRRCRKLLQPIERMVHLICQHRQIIFSNLSVFLEQFPHLLVCQEGQHAVCLCANTALHDRCNFRKQIFHANALAGAYIVIQDTVQIADFKFSGQQKAYRLLFPRHAEHLALEQTVRHYNLRQPTKAVFLTADKQAGFQKFALLFCRQRHILPPCRLFIPYKLLLKKLYRVSQTSSTRFLQSATHPTSNHRLTASQKRSMMNTSHRIRESFL